MISRYLASFAASRSGRRSDAGSAVVGARSGWRTRNADEGREHGHGEDHLHYARESSRPSRAAYRLVTRRRRASGDGQRASSAPAITIPPPSQIQTTSGDTIARNAAGGGSST